MDDDVLVVGDHTVHIRKWFDDRPTPLVFLRPDRFVAGTCLVQHAPATLDAILRSMTFTAGTAVPATVPDVPSSPQDETATPGLSGCAARRGGKRRWSASQEADHRRVARML